MNAEHEQRKKRKMERNAVRSLAWWLIAICALITLIAILFRKLF